MLLAVATATIALVAVRAVLGSAGEDSTRRALENTTRLADASRAQIQAALLLDPDVVFREVLDGEPDRICATGSGTAVPAGSPWPASCGASWTYADVDASASVVVKIAPPSPERPELVVSVAARAGSISAGYVDTYRVGGATRPTVFTGDTLDLADLAAGSGTAQLRGTVYASSSLRFDAGVNTASALLAAEEEITNLAAYPQDNGGAIGARRLAVASPDPAATPLRQPLRALFPVPLARDGLRASASTLAARACPTGATPVNTTDASGANRNSSLCLTAGANVVTTTGASVTAPAATAWLLLPNATAVEGGGSTLDVYYRTSTAAAPSCTNCDLRTLSAPSLAAGTHPGQITAWTKLATTYLPASGYVGTDATTHIGLCGAGFTDTGACTRWGSGTHDGVRTDADLVVVAGSVQRPRDVYLAGPVTADGGRLGVVATGDVKIPYWASGSTGDLSLQLDVAVLGRGDSAAIASFPASASASNAAGVVTLRGSVIGSKLGFAVSTGVFAGMQLHTPSVTRAGSLLPAPDLAWGRMSSKRMGAVELATMF